MILAIDVGNTHIVLGCIDGGNIRQVVRLHTDDRATMTEYAIQFKQILEVYDIDRRSFEGVIIASVVPAVTQTVREAAKLLTGLEPMIVGPGIRTGMNVRIDTPSTLAGDLVVGSVAAMACYGTPAIIVDLGTATTMVVVDRDNCYRGGVIVPGVMLSYSALAAGTSLLPDIAIMAPKKAVATNTVDAMRSGAVYGTAAMIDGMIDRMEAELGYKCTVVATGGLAGSIIPHCSHEIIYDDDLLMKGLWHLYKKNTQ